MDDPVDLTNLHSMTDGDKEMEKELFQEFLSSFKKGLSSLQQYCAENNTEAWRAESHALKGISLNLGANAIGELCKKAQDSNLADAAVKNEILKKMHTEYEKVKQFLLNIISH
jgi:HPt (histidine-containing phosphotransfer) domain-containing protein